MTITKTRLDQIIPENVQIMPQLHCQADSDGFNFSSDFFFTGTALIACQQD